MFKNARRLGREKFYQVKSNVSSYFLPQHLVLTNDTPTKVL